FLEEPGSWIVQYLGHGNREPTIPMKQSILLSLAACGAAATLVSCTPGERGALIGGALGAGTGALVGDTTGALVGGAVGAIAGSEISKNRAARNRYHYGHHGHYGHPHRRGHGHYGPPPRRGYRGY